jgi:hypothetical protein
MSPVDLHDEISLMYSISMAQAPRTEPGIHIAEVVNTNIDINESMSMTIYWVEPNMRHIYSAPESLIILTVFASL